MTATTTSAYQRRADQADWAEITAALDDLGCAVTPRLLTDTDAAGLIWLYDQDDAFRSTITMGRHRLVFTTRNRPIRSQRGGSAAPVRHGVSVVRSGARYTLGLLFQDAP